MSAIVSNEDVIKTGDTVYINGFKGIVESVDRDFCSCENRYLVCLPMSALYSEPSGGPIRIPAEHIKVETYDLNSSVKFIPISEIGEKAMNKRTVYHCVVVDTSNNALRDMPPLIAKDEEDAKIRTVATLDRFDPDTDEIIVMPIGSYTVRGEA